MKILKVAKRMENKQIIQQLIQMLLFYSQQKIASTKSLFPLNLKRGRIWLKIFIDREPHKLFLKGCVNWISISMTRFFFYNRNLNNIRFKRRIVNCYKLIATVQSFNLPLVKRANNLVIKTDIQVDLSELEKINLKKKFIIT